MKSYQIDTEALDAILLEMGHRENLSGTQYIRDAVIMYASGYTRMTKELYPEVAKLHGTTGQRVERCMRHSIEEAMTSADYRYLRKIFGSSIRADKGKPTNGDYIARLARLCRAD